MKTYARVIAVASALLMPFPAVATPDFFNQNIGSLDCGINEIAKFNGAEWVCADDLDSLSHAIEEIGDLGCSATQQDNSVLIQCDDGTSGVIAGAGTVVIYPEGQIGQVPPIDYNTGPIVAIDGSGVVLGEALDIDMAGPFPTIVIQLDAGRSGAFANAEDTQEVVFFSSAQELYFVSEDCSGTAFTASTLSISDVNHRFFVAGPAEPEQLLFKSSFRTGYWGYDINMKLYYFEPEECRALDLIMTGSPVVEYFFAPEITNAVYPVRVEQLP